MLRHGKSIFWMAVRYYALQWCIHTSTYIEVSNSSWMSAIFKCVTINDLVWPWCMGLWSSTSLIQECNIIYTADSWFGIPYSWHTEIIINNIVACWITDSSLTDYGTFEMAESHHAICHRNLRDTPQFQRFKCMSNCSVEYVEHDSKAFQQPLQCNPVQQTIIHTLFRSEVRRTGSISPTVCLSVATSPLAAALRIWLCTCRTCTQRWMSCVMP